MNRRCIDPLLASLLLLVLALCVGGAVAPAPAFAQKQAGPAGAPDLTALIDGIGGIEWRWTPRETQATLVQNKGGPQPIVVWVGRIVDVRLGQTATGTEESVIEFLAAYLPLAKPGPEALTAPVRVRPETGDHFVVSLRSPAVSPEMLKNLRRSVLDSRHYTVVLGEPRFIGPYGRQAAIFLQTVRAIVTQQLKVEMVRE
jgi:hypothetical protein